MRKGMVLAIDWDSCRLRIVHAGFRKKAMHVDLMLSVDIPASVDAADPEEMGKLIRQIIDQQKIRTRNVALDVPRDQVLLSTLRLPAASANEMPSMVEFQIAKELPFPLADAVVDFAMPNLDEAEGTVDVLVGTVRKEVVRYYQNTCEAAGLHLSSLGLRPYANKVALDELLAKDQPDCVVMVDVGPRMTEIDIIRGGALVFSRAASVLVPQKDMASTASSPEDTDGEVIRFPSEAAHGQEVEQLVQALLVEITRTVEAYRAGSPDMAVGAIVIGGSVGFEAKLAEAVGRRFGTSVELYNPASCFGWSEEQGREARGFAAALGLVAVHIGGGQRHFDFLDPKKTVTATEQRLRKVPRVAAAVVLVVAAGVTTYFLKVHPKQQELARIKKEIKVTQGAIRDLREFKTEVLKEVASFETDQVVWLDELSRLCGLLPDAKDMVIERIDMNMKGGEITIRLKSVNRQVVADAVDRIDGFRLDGNENQHFDAKSNALTTKDGDGRYTTSGSIEVVVIGNG